MTKPLVIYHKDCTDGFGAAFAAWLKLGDEAEYLPMHYKQSYDEFWHNEDETFDSEITLLNRDVYILDFSFPRWIMEGVFSIAKRVVWLDHHKTAFEMWCPYPFEKGLRYTPIQNDVGPHYIDLDDNKSGALLAWEFFHPGTEVPMLIRHIDDRDRWQFKLKGSKELRAALASYKPWSFEQWEEVIHDDHYGALWSEGRAILRAQDAAVADMMKQARKCRIPDENHDHNEMPWWDGLACNSQLHMSELGHELANQSGTYGLVWYVGADNKVKCSLRSNGYYDVSAIAKAFDGGGHRNAAGFQTDIETLMGWLA